MAPADPQPAMATTKRKFNILLDNLTANASSTSLASTVQESNTSIASHSRPTTPEPPSKRYRLSDVSTMERPRNVSGQERIQALKEQLLTPRKEGPLGSVRVIGSRKTPVKASTPRKPPNFQPYSQEQFLGRLKTFADVKKWTHKPDAIGEVEWAKRGWSCDTWNAVACKGGCEYRVVINLRPKRKDKDGNDIEMSEDLAEDIGEGLVEKYRQLIVDGHDEDCLWRKRGCQEDIYHIPIASRAKSSAELLNRYHSFKAITNDLPLLENIIYPDPRVEDILKRIPSTLWNSPSSDSAEEPPQTETDIVAFTFALFGWTGISESKISLATCNHCFQRIGLWLCADARLKEMSKKLDVPIESLRLNLLESHREHCPWKNPDVQCNAKDGPIANMAAWQTLEFMLVGKKREKEQKQHQRNIESVDLGSEYTYPRGSTESEERRKIDEDKDDSLHEKWKKFKAKLRRTTSRKSLKSSSKSVKSFKSWRSGKSTGANLEKGKENEVEKA